MRWFFVKLLEIIYLLAFVASMDPGSAKLTALIKQVIVTEGESRSGYKTFTKYEQVSNPVAYINQGSSPICPMYNARKDIEDKFTVWVYHNLSQIDEFVYGDRQVDDVFTPEYEISVNKIFWNVQNMKRRTTGNSGKEKLLGYVQGFWRREREIPPDFDFHLEDELFEIEKPRVKRFVLSGIVSAYKNVLNRNPEERLYSIEVDDQRSFVIQKQIDIPPATNYSVKTYVKRTVNFPLNFKLFAKVTGENSTGNRLTGSEILGKNPGLDFDKFIDNFTVKMKSSGRINLEYSWYAKVKAKVNYFDDIVIPPTEKTTRIPVMFKLPQSNFPLPLPETIFPETTQKTDDNSKDLDGNGYQLWMYIAVGLVIAVGVLFVIISLMYCRVRRITDVLTQQNIRDFMDGLSNSSAKQQMQGSEKGDSYALQMPYKKSLELPKEKINADYDKLLGSGEFGLVCEAATTIGTKTIKVALKMTKAGCSKVALLGFLSEIKILTYLDKHPNIVCIVGAYTAEMAKGIVYIATELCAGGSLLSYLRNVEGRTENYNSRQNQYENHSVRVRVGSSNSEDYEDLDEIEMNSMPAAQSQHAPITFAQIYQWCHDIACGMEFLGLKNVVHADIAARNVLLSGNKTAKITDFGLSRRLYDYSNYTRKGEEPLPWRWMAVESLKQMKFSFQSDVWSYGITMWEIFSLGDQPYPGVAWDLGFVQRLIDGERLLCPTNASPEIYDIMKNCWHLEPSQRPTFTELRLSLGQLMTSSRK